MRNPQQENVSRDQLERIASIVMVSVRNRRGHEGNLLAWMIIQSALFGEFREFGMAVLKIGRRHTSSLLACVRMCH
jgi:hypothetical protein